MAKFLKQHAGSLLLSVLLHLVLIGLLGVSLAFSRPQRPMQRLAIEAVVVDMSAVTAQQRAQEELERQRQQALQAQREREAVERRQREEAAAREEEEQRQREAAEREAQRKAQEEAQRQAEEAKRQAEEEAKRKAAEEKRKAEEEARRKREAEAKRREEQARQQREAELQAQLQAEEELLALTNSPLMSQYVLQIQQRIERSWIRPLSTQEGLRCELNVTQLRSGDVVDVRVGRCNGDAAVVRSLEAAVLRASPLPEPPDPRLYSRNLIIDFRPE